MYLLATQKNDSPVVKLIITKVIYENKVKKTISYQFSVMISTHFVLSRLTIKIESKRRRFAIFYYEKFRIMKLISCIFLIIF